MRHRVAGKKLGRNGAHRKALVRNMMKSFFKEFEKKGFITTTRVKAKFIQPHVEKMISLSREKSVHNIRRAMSVLGDRAIVQALFDKIGPYYQERPGGYTRVLRMTKPRFGDNSVRAYLGYVREDEALADGDCRARHRDGAMETATEPTSAQTEAEEGPEAPAEGGGVEETETPIEEDSADPSEDEELEEDSKSEGTEVASDRAGEEEGPSPEEENKASSD